MLNSPRLCLLVAKHTLQLIIHRCGTGPVLCHNRLLEIESMFNDCHVNALATALSTAPSVAVKVIVLGLLPSRTEVNEGVFVLLKPGVELLYLLDGITFSIVG